MQVGGVSKIFTNYTVVSDASIFNVLFLQQIRPFVWEVQEAT